ncbi:hypothetical protein HII31_07045 [Pseudocercospora fuligena]|uniref:SnoaL-like domain-containing protein n=1 Tax=Pseudocercospora fuligena TaxID=685502 RepID=A0A8H6RIJ5_9PEZI|nr:hypothetical protein HII31_07045 [Pseudocercospora fuligena]
MYAVTPDTILPSCMTLSPKFVELLDNFFQAVDDIVNNDPSASERFREIFAPDGVWKTPTMKFSGHDELANSNETWPYFKLLKFFQHRVLKIFTYDNKGTEMMLLGRIVLDRTDGVHEEFEFSARVEIDDTSIDAPRLKFFQGWSSRV